MNDFVFIVIMLIFIMIMGGMFWDCCKSKTEEPISYEKFLSEFDTNYRSAVFYYAGFDQKAVGCIEFEELKKIYRKLEVGVYFGTAPTKRRPCGIRIEMDITKDIFHVTESWDNRKYTVRRKKVSGEWSHGIMWGE